MKFKKMMKVIILYFSNKFPFFRKTARKIFFWNGQRKYKKNLVIQTNENLIIFESFMGKSYSDSPKAIYEYLLKTKKYNHLKFVWAFEDPLKYQFLKNEKTKIVKYDSEEYYQLYAKSKFWITNSRIPAFIIKKEDQFYVQCWHGTPFKKLCYDIKTDFTSALNTLEELKEKYDIDTKRYNYMISPSQFTSDKYRSAFNLKKVNPDCKIIEKGYPRNDFLFKYTKSDKDKIKKTIGIKTNKKIILYAPTWRDNQYSAQSGYILNLAIDFEKLFKQLGDEYIILFRTHAFISNSFDFERYESFVYDVSKYDDITELYVIADILITDYSSVFFDFANLKKPILFYMYDLKLYKNKLRDFYLDLDELPGPIIEAEEELINEIKNVSNYDLKYQKKYKKFNEKYNYLDDANSSKRIVEEIMDVENKEKNQK